MKYLILIILLLSLQIRAEDLKCDGISSEITLGGGIPYLFRILNRAYDPCLKDIKAPTSKEELCKLKGRDIQALFCQTENRLGFDNQGGLFGFNTGLCWWISKFHRNAIYKTYYKENEPKPSPKEVKEIFNAIVRNKGPVKIPGYKNLNEFTSDPYVKFLLIKKMQHYMEYETFLKFEWIKGLKGSKGKINQDINNGQGTSVTYEQIFNYRNKDEHSKKGKKIIEKQRMEVSKVFEAVNKEDELSYIMLQYPGAPAHAAIVFDAKKEMDKNGEEIYILKVQDSNYQNENPKLKETENQYSTYVFKDGYWFLNKYNDPEEDFNSQIFFPDDFNIYVQNEKNLKKTLGKLGEMCE